MTITPEFHGNTQSPRALQVETLAQSASTAPPGARQEPEDGPNGAGEDDGSLWRVLHWIVSEAAEADAAMATLYGVCPRHQPFTDD